MFLDVANVKSTCCVLVIEKLRVVKELKKENGITLVIKLDDT